MKIFQTSILFETNKFHDGGSRASGGPGQLPPLPPFNSALVIWFIEVTCVARSSHQKKMV